MSVDYLEQLKTDGVHKGYYNVAEAVFNMGKCKTQTELMDSLLEKSTKFKFDECLTCEQLITQIQTVMSNLLWFAYADYQNGAFVSKCNDLVFNLEKMCSNFDSVDESTQLILLENVKLIKAVLVYQGAKGLDLSGSCSLKDIKEELIINPVSQIVYNNYLGLTLRKEASVVLRNACSIEDERDLSYESMSKMLAFEQYTKEDIETVDMLIQKAREHFDMAAFLAEQLSVWEGYLEYNLIRLRVMSYLITPIHKEDIIIGIREVVNIRKVLSLVFKKDESYLGKMFLEEYEAALSLYANFQSLV